MSLLLRMSTPPATSIIHLSLFCHLKKISVNHYKSLLNFRIITANVQILYLKFGCSMQLEPCVLLTYLNIHLPFSPPTINRDPYHFMDYCNSLLTKLHSSSVSSHCHYINPAKKLLYSTGLEVISILINPWSSKCSNLSRSRPSIMYNLILETGPERNPAHRSREDTIWKWCIHSNCKASWWTLIKFSKLYFKSLILITWKLIKFPWLVPSSKLSVFAMGFLNTLCTLLGATIMLCHSCGPCVPAKSCEMGKMRSKAL